MASLQSNTPAAADKVFKQFAKTIPQMDYYAQEVSRIAGEKDISPTSLSSVSTLLASVAPFVNPLLNDAFQRVQPGKGPAESAFLTLLDEYWMPGRDKTFEGKPFFYIAQVLRRGLVLPPSEVSTPFTPVPSNELQLTIPSLFQQHQIALDYVKKKRIADLKEDPTENDFAWCKDFIGDESRKVISYKSVDGVDIGDGSQPAGTSEIAVDFLSDDCVRSHVKKWRKDGEVSSFLRFDVVSALFEDFLSPQGYKIQPS